MHVLGREPSHMKTAPRLLTFHNTLVWHRQPFPRLRMRHLSSAVFLCALCGMPAAVVASQQVTQVHWEEVRDSDGIKVFIGRVADEPIAMVKTEVTIDAGLGRIKEVLDDVAGRVKWVPYLSESRILQELTPTEKLHYDRFAAPWPAADRDIVYRGTTVHESDHGIVYIMKSEPVSSLPEQKGVVRAQLTESSYTLTAVNESQTRVELIFHADPRGWLPLWIVNIIHRAFPFRVLENLREQAME